MTNAIVIAAAIVAAAIMFTNHWEITSHGHQITDNGYSPRALRLNRWTGKIDVCVTKPEFSCR